MIVMIDLSLGLRSRNNDAVVSPDTHMMKVEYVLHRREDPESTKGGPPEPIADDCEAGTVNNRSSLASRCTLSKG